MYSTSTMTSATAQSTTDNPVESLLHEERNLTPEELETLAAEIVASGAWRDQVIVDEGRRVYVRLHGTPYVDVWLLLWMPGQGTGLHDHEGSSVGICVAQGELLEIRPQVDFLLAHERLPAGSRCRGGIGYIHDVRHHGGDPAVSVHAYSPPLSRVGEYRIDEQGYLLRMPGTEETDLGG